jgi:DNA transformation protein
MLEALRNLGPKSEAMLRHSGITSVEQLRELGAVRAYVKVKCNDAGASLNLLWALEGALSNRPWQEVAKQDRLSLLMQVEEIEKADRSTSRSRK